MSNAKSTAKVQSAYRKDVPAIIRQYPAPRPGYQGEHPMSLDVLAAYCKFYGYRVRGWRGEAIEIEPDPFALAAAGGE